jgi:hypothetical protein
MCKKAFEKLKVIKELSQKDNTLILHVDSTYKLAKSGFQVFVFGYSDANGIFHLLSVFLSSHKNANAQTLMMESMETLWQSYYSGPLPFTHLMADADQGTASMFLRKYGQTSKKQLMCYWHVAEAVSVL